jgi:hypothetical protein
MYFQVILLVVGSDIFDTAKGEVEKVSPPPLQIK